MELQIPLQMPLQIKYKEFIQLKRDSSLCRLRLKKNPLSDAKNKLETISVNIDKIKSILSVLKNTRMIYIKNEYNLHNYVRSDNQLKNLNKLEEDLIYDKIYKDTSFFEGDVKVRLFILIYGFNKDDITCESKDCKCIKVFNKSTNYFNTFCNIKHSDQQKITHDKLKVTLNKKYNVSNQNQIKGLVRKNKVPHVYKDRHPMQQTIDNIENYNKEYIEKTFILENELNLSTMMEYFNISKMTCYQQLKKMNITYLRKCSRKEEELFNYINSFDLNILRNDRAHISPLELDILVPDSNIAFEFNGLYWHSYGINNVNSKQENLRYMKNRHFIKTNTARLKSIQLFHIFENEWIDPVKQNIWKSQISNALKQNKKTIGARKCEIVEISHNDSSLFLDNNHLQGKSVSGIQIALKYNDEIVSLMTFGKSRYDKSIDYEMMRFCSKLYTQVPGAASKLLKYFINKYKPTGLVSYANARWSNGHLYKTLNFKEESFSNPNYFYYHSSNPSALFSRVQFQKHKLESKLDTFDASKTEMQNMIENGYRAIFDAGNYKFTYRISDIV